MAMTLQKSFAAALMCGAMCFAGSSFAAKAVTSHVTTHQKAAALKPSASEMKERQQTAELNRAQLTGAQISIAATAQSDQMTQAMLEEEDDLLSMQQASLENEDGTAVD